MCGQPVPTYCNALNRLSWRIAQQTRRGGRCPGLVSCKSAIRDPGPRCVMLRQQDLVLVSSPLQTSIMQCSRITFFAAVHGSSFVNCAGAPHTQSGSWAHGCGERYDHCAGCAQALGFVPCTSTVHCLACEIGRRVLACLPCSIRKVQPATDMPPIL